MEGTSLPPLGAGQEEAESKICSFLRMQVLASVAVIPVLILNDPEPSFDKKNVLFTVSVSELFNHHYKRFLTSAKCNSSSSAGPPWDNRIPVGKEQDAKGIPR